MSTDCLLNGLCSYSNYNKLAITSLGCKSRRPRLAQSATVAVTSWGIARTLSARRQSGSGPARALVLLSHKNPTYSILLYANPKCSIQAHLHPDRGTGMDGGSSEWSEARFAAYVEALGTVLGHADRQQPMHDYCLL